MGSQRRNQRNEFFSRWLCLRFGIHRILESKSDSPVEKILHGCLREKMQPNLASYRYHSKIENLRVGARAEIASTAHADWTRRASRMQQKRAGCDEVGWVDVNSRSLQDGSASDSECVRRAASIHRTSRRTLRNQRMSPPDRLPALSDRPVQD